MTRAIAWPLVCAVLTLAAGCTKTAACKAGTLLVTVDLDATASAADSLHVTVAVTGGQTFTGVAAHASSAAAGTLEVDFPTGAYSAGKPATVTIAAFRAGAMLGSGAASLSQLAASCSTVAVTVRSMLGDMGAGDLAGSDMTPPAKVFSLRAAVDYADGPSTGVPYSAAIGDLNGDGKNDIAVTNDAAGVAILLNNGDGTFGAPVLYQANQHPQSVALGDVNGDGTIDVVVADSQSNDVTVFFNNGSGVITQAGLYQVGTDPGGSGANAIALADFNGDSKLDLAVAAANGANVFLNQGNGTFPTTATVYAAGMRPAGIGSADLNGDGKHDLVVANSGSANVSVLLNNGSGVFAAAVNYTVGSYPVNVDLGDVTGDGKPDIAVACTEGMGGVTVLVNKGDASGTFPTSFAVDANEPGPTGVAIGDIDGDQKNDIVLANNNDGLIYVLHNMGGNAFAAPQRWAAGAFAYDVHLGDLGNGHLDIVATNGGSGDTTVILNDGAGNLVAGANYVSGIGSIAVVVADVNTDGKDDLLLANNGSGAGVMLGKGDGTFQPFVSYTAGTSPVGIVSGDFDGDGWIDLALANAGTTTVAGSLTVLTNKKDGTFNAAVPYTAGTTPSGLAVGDLSGDGKLDLVVANGGSNNISVFVNTGTGAFAAPATYAAGAKPSAVAVGDVNGDHAKDVVIANSGSGNVTVYLNDGTGKLTTPTTFMAGMAPASVLLVDLDGDGALDIVVRDGGLANVDVLKGNGNGTFAAPVPYPVDSGFATAMVAAADLDGDGQLDLVATDASEQVSVLLGKGGATFAPRIVYAGGEDPTGIAIADFDKDGRPDVVVTDTAANLNGGVTVLLNTTH